MKKKILSSIFFLAGALGCLLFTTAHGLGDEAKESPAPTERPSPEELVGIWVADEMPEIDDIEFKGATKGELRIRKLKSNVWWWAWHVEMFLSDGQRLWKVEDSNPGRISEEGDVLLGPIGSTLRLKPTLHHGELRLEFRSGEMIRFRKVEKENLDVDVELEKTFQRWEAGLDVVPRDRRNWVRHSWVDRAYLAGLVAKAPEFFLEKLKKNELVVVILDASELGEKYNDQFTGVMGLQSRLRMWEAILEKEKRFTAAHGLEDATKKSPAPAERPSPEELVGIWVADKMPNIDDIEFKNATRGEIRVRKRISRDGMESLGSWHVDIFMSDGQELWKVENGQPGWIREGDIYVGPTDSVLSLKPTLHHGELYLELPSGTVIHFRKVETEKWEVDVELEKTFQRWEAGLEVERLGKNGGVHDQRADREYLAGLVAKAPGFFLEKMKKNMLVVLILDSSELREKHGDQFAGVSGLHNRLRVWEAILEKEKEKQP